MEQIISAIFGIVCGIALILMSDIPEMMVAMHEYVLNAIFDDEDVAENLK